MLYASYARGFKSGGFNADRVTVPPVLPDLCEFDDEQSDSFEGGFKSRWWDGLFTLNATFFYTFYKDFQAFSFDGTSFLVTNADDLRSYGVEAETILAPLEGLVLGSNMGFNIAEFEDFDNALCTDAQSAAAAGTACTQDLSGERLDNAPRWSFSTFGMLERPLPALPGLDLDWFARVDWAYTSRVNLAQDLDSRLWQDGYHLLGLRGGIRTADRRLEFSLWMKNALDEEYNVIAFDVPVIGGLGGINGAPRTFGAMVRYTY
jgi:iron complex outermembrane receptor protein